MFAPAVLVPGAYIDIVEAALMVRPGLKPGDKKAGPDWSAFGMP